MSAREFRAFVDRMEGDKAVLLLDKEKQHIVVLPKELLPDGVTEGAVLTLRIKFEPEKTAEMAEQVAELIEKMTNDADS